MLFGEGLAQANGEDQLAVRQVSQDLPDAPLARLRAAISLGRRERIDEDVDSFDGRGNDRDRILSVEKSGVGIQLHFHDGITTGRSSRHRSVTGLCGLCSRLPWVVGSDTPEVTFEIPAGKGASPVV